MAAGTPPHPDYLLDTDIIVHYTRGKAVARRIEADYALPSDPRRRLVCIVSYGEARSLAKKLAWGAGRTAALHRLTGATAP